MKKSLIYAVLFSMCLAPVVASAASFNFNDQLTNPSVALVQDRLDNFADDLGAVMVAGSYHSGKTLGFPGLDVGIHLPLLNVSDKDSIVKASGLSYFGFPVLQLEIGLPANLDLLVRYASVSGYASISDASLTGYGLRYGIIRNSMPFLPNLSVQGISNTVSITAGESKIAATSMDVSALASFNIPIVDPYVGLGYYSSTVTPDAAIATPQPGMKGTGTGMRIEAGLNMGLIPLTYLQLGMVYVNGGVGGVLGIGARF